MTKDLRLQFSGSLAPDFDIRDFAQAQQFLREEEEEEGLTTFEEEVDHNCAVALAYSLPDLYDFIKAQQHRGREAAGIAAIGHHQIDVIKWLGRVDAFDIKSLQNIFPGHKYHTYLGHVRYATKGKKTLTEILQNAHPHAIGGEVLDLGDHMYIFDCDAVIVHNGHVRDEFLQDIDTRNLRTDCDSEKLLRFFVKHGEEEVLRRIPGAYTAIFAQKRRAETVVLRDTHGIRPGVLGHKDKHGVASESVALTENHGRVIRDIELGSAYYFGAQGRFRHRQIMNPQPAYCAFEKTYVASPKTFMNRVSVLLVREIHGRILAEELPNEVVQDLDYVTYAPDCPKEAAQVIADALGLPMIEVFYKKRRERTFQGSTAEEREASAKVNLNLNPKKKEKIKRKNVLVVEDSTVRGNVARRIKYLLYDIAEVNQAYIANCSPPIGIIGDDGQKRYCDMGVDMPKDDEFIARGRTMQEIEEKVGIPVLYISLQGYLDGFKKNGMDPKNLCTFCFGGNHPFDKV